MKRAIIFGCGKIGMTAYNKLKRYYQIIAWSDNNDSLWGGQREGIPIIKPAEIPVIMQKEEVDIFVSMEYADEVIQQLKMLLVKNIFVWKRGFFYSVDNLYPMEFPVDAFHVANKGEVLHILFVSATANIRDHKTAKAVKKAGHHIYLAYLVASPHEASPEYADIYEGIFPIMSMAGLAEFVEQSDFDIIHSSSEPDFLTPLLIRTNKVIIHDCHDLGSSQRCMSPEELMIEYIAHVGADGVIYPTEGLREAAVKRFNISRDKTYVLENFISEDMIPQVRKEKRSALDGELHCVYEGVITEGDKQNKRYFEEIWLKFANDGLHVHFYTNYDIRYCKFLESLHPNIHYEGNMSSKQLATEMSQYDVGICIYNATIQNRQYLENGSPNKLFEYVNAGIPVAVGDVKALKLLVEENGLGKEVYMDRNLYSQIEEIAKIQIKDNVLQNKGFILENRVQGLLELYKKSISIRKKGRYFLEK